jgi:hypothetical protein
MPKLISKSTQTTEIIKKLRISPLNGIFCDRIKIKNITKKKEETYFRYKNLKKKPNKTIHDIKKIASLEYNLEIMFDYQKNYSIAISYYKLSSKKNNRLSSFNLGCIYMDKHKINKSLNYFNKLSDEDIKMKEILKLTYINRIVLLYKSNNIESKIENIKKNINKMININKITLAKILINFLENDYILAIKNFNSIKNHNLFNDLIKKFKDFLIDEYLFLLRISACWEKNKQRMKLLFKDIKNKKIKLNYKEFNLNFNNNRINKLKSL